MSGCWAFAVNTVDGAVPAPLVVASSVPVRQGWWVQLTGIRDVGTGATKLYVCEIGYGEETGDGSPVLAQAAAPTLTWNAAGSLRLGQGRAAGAAANPWSGRISGAQVWTAPLAEEDIGQSCQNATLPELP
jgi:hypothetical protein